MTELILVCLKSGEEELKYSPNDKIWTRFRMTRREFLRHFGIASSAITLSPFFIERWSSAFADVSMIPVYLVKNGDCFQNTAKIWEMLDGPAKYIEPGDVVVIKGNCQWQKQGFTHTGAMKGVIDKILEIPGFSGEILICDNTQEYGGGGWFDAPLWAREHNWLDHSWKTLADEYQANGKPVAIKQWYNSTGDITGPESGEGWIRDWFSFHGRGTYLSYPVFESPLSPGRMVDLRNGVWENDSYTGAVKSIFMPTLNNHGNGSDDYAGVTSAIKSFFGATEIHGGVSGTFSNFYNIHSSSYQINRSDYAGELVARYIQTMFAPDLYITAAMWSGHDSRTGNATETKTILACENPVTLDYVSAKYVISPYASWLDPDQDNHTRRTILGCISSGVGTINPAEFEIISYDFLNPTVSRLDIDRKIRDFKADPGSTTESDVKQMINEYMETS